MMASQGIVFWLTGLSGVGKTTVAKLLTTKLRANDLPVIMLDGDVLRDVFGEPSGYDYQWRLQLSQRYSKLCHMIAAQGTHVVIATISMFHKTQAWNRQHINHYLEIYLKAPLSVLKSRDSKGIYALAASGEMNDVVGCDVLYEEPLSPDLIINNYGDYGPEDTVKSILNLTSNKAEYCL